MKNFMKCLAIFFAIGAMVQTVGVYAIEEVKYSLEKDGEAIIKLIEFRQRVAARGDSIEDASIELVNDFPEIKTDDDFKNSFGELVIRYSNAIGMEKVLYQMVNKKELKRMSGEGPGI
jgi:hypothetical protein